MGDEMDFETWMIRVNDLIVRATGVTSDDLPDYMYHDDFEDGCTPREAAENALEYAEEF